MEKTDVQDIKEAEFKDVKQKKSFKDLFNTSKNWYNQKNRYGWSWYEKPKNWIRLLTIPPLLIYGSYKGIDKLNDHVIEDSYYTGNVVSFGKEGIIWQNYQGSLAIGGELRSVTGSFNLDNEARNGENIEELASKLYEALKTNKKVRVHGKQYLINWPWRSST